MGLPDLSSLSNSQLLQISSLQQNNKDQKGPQLGLNNTLGVNNQTPNMGVSAAPNSNSNISPLGSPMNSNPKSIQSGLLGPPRNPGQQGGGFQQIQTGAYDPNGLAINQGIDTAYAKEKGIVGQGFQGGGNMLPSSNSGGISGDGLIHGDYQNNMFTGAAIPAQPNSTVKPMMPTTQGSLYGPTSTAPQISMPQIQSLNSPVQMQSPSMTNSMGPNRIGPGGIPGSNTMAKQGFNTQRFFNTDPTAGANTGVMGPTQAGFHGTFAGNGVYDRTGGYSDFEGASLVGDFNHHLSVDNLFPQNNDTWLMTRVGPMFKSDIQKQIDQNYWANVTGGGQGLWGSMVNHNKQLHSLLGIPQYYDGDNSPSMDNGADATDPGTLWHPHVKSGNQSAGILNALVGPPQSMNVAYNQQPSGGFSRGPLDDPYGGGSSLKDPYGGGFSSGSPLNNPYGGGD